VALTLILGGWVAARAMVWDAVELGGPVSASPAFALAAPDVLPSPPAALPRDVVDSPAPQPPPHLFLPSGQQAISAALRSSGQLAPLPGSGLPQSQRSTPAPRFVRRQATTVPAGLAVLHPSLWIAALAHLRLPARGLRLFSAPAQSELVPSPSASPSASVSAPVPAPRASAWSAEAWLLLRQGGNVLNATGLVPATYGASQAGAVIRYQLAPESAHRPALYLRGSAALNGSHEREAAVGLSARPFARLPLVAAAEARVNQQPGGTRLRPAAFVYTELPPIALPLGAKGEFYGQAGYVGGNFASAFADGQLRIDRRFLTLGNGELRAGGGVWGGAQKGASRLDVGPTATLGMPLVGTAGARLGVDWRFRVAGNAAPASGPAVTLSAGF
jgi:hypothetical protein